MADVDKSTHLEPSYFRTQVVRKMSILAFVCEILGVVVYLGLVVFTQNVIFVVLCLYTATGLIVYCTSFKLSKHHLDFACWLLIITIVAEVSGGYFLLGNSIPLPAAYMYPISLSSAILKKRQAIFVSSICIMLIVVSVVCEKGLNIYSPVVTVGPTAKILMNLIIYAFVIPGCAFILISLHTEFYSKLQKAAKQISLKNKELSLLITREQKLSKLNADLQKIQQESMEKTSANLHNEILPYISSLVQTYNNPNRREFDNRIQELIEKVRNIMGELWPHYLKENLILAFNELIYSCKSQYTTIDFQIVKDGNLDILESLVDVDFRVGLYYVVRECLRNAINHSKADKISILIDFNEDIDIDDSGSNDQVLYRLEIRVRDNGVGIDLNLLKEGRDVPCHIGLQFVHTEVERLGGFINFFVKTKSNQENLTDSGTTVTLTFPKIGKAITRARVHTV